MRDEALKINLSESLAEGARLAARRRYYLADAANLAARAVTHGAEPPLPPADLSCAELVGYASMLFDALLMPAQLVYHEGGARIAYFRQGYADAAYSLFSESLDGATVLYTDSGRAAAEAVFSEEADFCILPFADRDGHLVRSARAIIEELGLLLAGTASVGAGESGALTYALYGRAPLSPTSPLLSLSLRLPYTSDEALKGLFAAAEEVQAKMDAIEGARSGAILRVSLSVRAEMLDRLLFILRQFPFDTDVVGLVPSSEE